MSGPSLFEQVIEKGDAIWLRVLWFLWRHCFVLSQLGVQVSTPARVRVGRAVVSRFGETYQMLFSSFRTQQSGSR